MFHSRLSAIFGLVLTCSFVISGCGGSGGGNDPAPSANGPPSGTGNPPPSTSAPLFVLSANNGTTGYELYGSDGTAAGTRLVKDINTNTSSNPDNLTVINGVTYFTASDGVHGTELWKTDGTAGGTELLKDINPGAGSGVAGWWLSMTPAGSAFYFVANDGVHGNELWRSDGTSAGTTLLKDINPGAASGGDYSDPFIVGTVLYFMADDGTQGYELWKSDGTEAGTVMVKDINPNVGQGSFPNNFISMSGTIYFRANDGGGYELWKSDGTTEGTVMVKDINPGAAGSDAQNLTLFNGAIYLIAAQPATGYELWKSNGTDDGTVLVKDINPGTGGSRPNGSFDGGFVAIGTTLYFIANDGMHGDELWKSNGTDAGTVLVKDIRPGSANSSPAYWREFIAIGTTLYFLANDGTTGDELWKSDGSEAGTVLVKDINTSAGFSSPYESIAFNSELYFRIYDSTRGSELWKSNGTDAGTVMLKNISAGANSGTVDPHFTVAGSFLYFVGADGRLWKSDGTSLGTIPVKEINSFAGWSGIYQIQALGGEVYFNAHDGLHGQELWHSNGTEVGTAMVADINTTVTDNADSYNFVTMGGIHYFTADDGTGFDEQLWRSDGTNAGTYRVKDIEPDGQPMVAGNLLYFAAYDAATGYELWKSDGTEAGTGVLKDINPGAQYSDVYGLTAVGSMFYFVANDNSNGAELWKTDGTATGTVLVKDINPGTGSSYPGNEDYADGAAVAGSAFYFVADDGTHGAELWKSDGSEAGTQMVKDISPGAGGAFTSCYADCLNAVVANLFYFTANGELWKTDGTEVGTVMVKEMIPGAALIKNSTYFGTVFGGVVYFMANDTTHGYELWKTDGTAAGTSLVKDIVPGIGSSNLFNFTSIGNTLYFTARETTDAYVLWKTDGTDAGTVMLKSIVPSGGDNPYNFTAVGNLLYFVANDGAHGDEVWVSDGTETGTRMLKDINPGLGNGYSANYSEDDFIGVGDVLYFRAYEPTTGYELWRTDGSFTGTVRVTDLYSGTADGIGTILH